MGGLRAGIGPFENPAGIYQLCVLFLNLRVLLLPSRPPSSHIVPLWRQGRVPRGLADPRAAQIHRLSLLPKLQLSLERGTRVVLGQRCPPACLQAEISPPGTSWGFCHGTDPQAAAGLCWVFTGPGGQQGCWSHHGQGFCRVWGWIPEVSLRKPQQDHSKHFFLSVGHVLFLHPSHFTPIAFLE